MTTVAKKQIAITLSPWVLDELLGGVKNRSAFIEELIIKALMQKKDNTFRAQIKKSAPFGNYVRMDPVSTFAFLLYFEAFCSK